jgi:hypothetical protein
VCDYVVKRPPCSRTRFRLLQLDADDLEITAPV